MPFMARGFTSGKLVPLAGKSPRTSTPISAPSTIYKSKWEANNGEVYQERYTVRGKRTIRPTSQAVLGMLPYT